MMIMMMHLQLYMEQLYHIMLNYDLFNVDVFALEIMNDIMRCNWLSYWHSGLWQLIYCVNLIGYGVN